MMNYMQGSYGVGLGLPLWVPGIFIILAIWGLAWKGFALWHSAKRGDKWWFIALLLINTVGILEIVYLFAFAKMKLSDLLPVAPTAPKAPENESTPTI